MSMSQPDSFPCGQVVLNRYRLDEVLDSGTSWIVVAATDLELDRKVTLKLICPPEQSSRGRSLSLWLQGALIALLALASALLALSR